MNLHNPSAGFSNYQDFAKLALTVSLSLSIFCVIVSSVVPVIHPYNTQLLFSC